MVNSPSQKWEKGVLVERAIETNRWRVDADGKPIGEDEVIEPKATKPYKTPVPTPSAANRKRVESAEAENKAVKKSAATKKASTRIGRRRP